MEKFRVVYRDLESSDPGKEWFIEYEEDDCSRVKRVCKEFFSGRFELVRIELVF